MIVTFYRCTTLYWLIGLFCLFETDQQVNIKLTFKKTFSILIIILIKMWASVYPWEIMMVCALWCYGILEVMFFDSCRFPVTFLLLLLLLLCCSFKYFYGFIPLKCTHITGTHILRRKVNIQNVFQRDTLHVLENKRNKPVFVIYILYFANINVYFVFNINTFAFT